MILRAILGWIELMLVFMADTIGDRYRRTRLAVLIAIGEPIGVIAVFSLTHSLISPVPPFGSSTVLFFATGILPFYLFFHVSWRLRSWDWLRRLPRMTEFDLLVVHVLDEILTKVIIILLCAFGLWVLDVPDAWPNDPLVCLLALFVGSAIGIAVGLINAVIFAFFYAWPYIYAIVIRGFLAFSGVLFVVDWMPVPLREVAAYNPIAHYITLYRAGYYQNYPSATLDMQFLLLTTTGMLALSAIFLLGTRAWRTR